jgi:uncharacterized protein (DUF427 family)
MALSRTLSGKVMQSGFADHPDHVIRIGPAGRLVSVEAGGRSLVETAKALILREAAYRPVYYFPREEVDMSALRRSAHSTWCPFKGAASYFSIGDAPALENAVWSYEDPFEECAAIKDCLAFYPERVSIREPAL